MLQDALTTLGLLRAAVASSRHAPARLRRTQATSLARLLTHAYDRVPLYRRLYDEAGFHPSSFRTLDDLERIPRLTKSRLRATPPEDAVAAGTDLAQCTTVSTSGSTGMPLQLRLGRFERCWHRAVAWRVLFEHGYRWTDRTLEIRMKRGASYAVQRFGVAAKDWASILAPPESWVELLARRRHDVVIAGAGTLHDLAVAAAATRLPIRPPRLIVSDSETLTPATRRLVRETLGTDPVDVYGLVEVSDFAWQCERRAGFHVSAASHVVEVDAAPGRPGPLVVTALGMRTTPIIRYETGDLAEMSTEACGCGRGLPLLARLHGRAVESLALPDGGRLRWPVFHELLGERADVARWQVVQHDPLTIVVRVVPMRPCPGTIPAVQAALRTALPAEVAIRVEAVDAIPRAANGKQRLVVPAP